MLGHERLQLEQVFVVIGLRLKAGETQHRVTRRGLGHQADLRVQGFGQGRQRVGRWHGEANHKARTVATGVLRHRSGHGNLYGLGCLGDGRDHGDALLARVFAKNIGRQDAETLAARLGLGHGDLGHHIRRLFAHLKTAVRAHHGEVGFFDRVHVARAEQGAGQG